MKCSKSQAWYNGWIVTRRGGPGSGHHGHKGVPGQKGGSLPRAAVVAPTSGVGFVQTIDDVIARQLGNKTTSKTYWIMPDGKALLDVNADIPIQTGTHASGVISYPEQFGLDQNLIDEAREYQKQGHYPLLTGGTYMGEAIANGAARVQHLIGPAKRQVIIDGLFDDRKSLRKIQDMILISRMIPDDKGAEYTWTPDKSNNFYSFTWDRLMAAGSLSDL